MKKLFYILALLVCAASLHADSPTTGQFLFQQKPSTGPFTQFGVTPIANQAFGWDGTKVTMLSPSGGTAWGGITGTLSNQTDLQTALNAKLSLTGTLAIANFGSITGILPVGNLPGTVQYTNGALSLAGFSSITGTLDDARLTGNVQLKNGALAFSGFSGITGRLATANVPTNTQFTDGAFSFSGFASIGGSLPPANGGLGQSNSFQLGDIVSGTNGGTLTRLAGNTATSKKFLAQTGTGSVSADPAWSGLSLSDVPSGVLLSSNNLSDVSSITIAITNLLPSQTGNSGKVLETNGTVASWANGGTVTSVALSVPGIFSLSGSPITSSGTMTMTVANEAANLIWAGPINGSPAVPNFRSLVAGDLPDISSTYLTTSAATADYQPLSGNLTALAATSGTNSIYYRSASNTWTPVTIGSNLAFSGGTLSSTAGGGSVTSVSLALPGIFALSGSPITSAGTITATLDNQSIKTFFAGPASGGAGTPAFRLIASGDIPDLSATYLTPSAAASAYQPLNAGLTSLSGLSTTGDLYYLSAANTWSAVTVGSGLSFTSGSLTATTSGTVSSVALTLPSSIITVTGSPITSSGTIAGALANQAANHVWAGPTTGSATAPTFRALVAGDIPDISATYLTPAAGNAAYQALNGNLTSLSSASATNSIYYRVTSNTWAPITITGNTTLSGGVLNTTGVTSVGLTVPSIFSLGGSPVTNSGTIAISLNTAPPNQFLGGASSGGSSTPAFRVLALADIPSLSSVYQPLNAGLTSLGGLSTTNTIYYLSAANTWSAVTIGTGLSLTTGTLASTVSGSVTSVALALPGIFTVSGSPVTTSGTLTGALATQTANLVFAGPATGSAAAPTFRSLAVADIPSIDLLLPSQTGNSGFVLTTNGTASSWAAFPTFGANTFTGAQTLSGGIVGVTTGSSASSGNVGEVIQSIVPVGSGVALTTATGTNVTSISLTAGDWDVDGDVSFSDVAATTLATSGGISTTSATVPADGTEVYSGVLATVGTVRNSVTLPRKVINVSSTTTVYLVGSVTFTAGSVSAFGVITARRIR